MTDRLEHIKTTPEGFTHWSSGPSNRIFDPQCGACWQEEVERLRGELATQDESHQAWMTMAKEHIEQSVDGERELRATIATLREALVRIAEGRGQYSTDHFEHCRNTVEDMKALAVKALATEAPQ